MTKQRKNICPDGFKLDKYEDSRDWVPSNWLNALSFRGTQYLACLGSTSLSPQKLESLRKLAQEIIDDPLKGREPIFDENPVSDQTVLDFFDGYEAIQRDINYAKWHDATLNNHYEDINDVPGFLGVDTSKPLFLIEKEVELIPARRMHFFLDDYYSKKASKGVPLEGSRWRPAPWKAFIKVNMLLSDQILKEAFEGWLRTARTEFNQRYPVTKLARIDLSTWYAKRYLPMLDLKFWAATNCVDLSYSFLTDKVFDGCVDATGEDAGIDETNVRKTIYPNALELLTPSSLRSLKHLCDNTP